MRACCSFFYRRLSPLALILWGVLIFQPGTTTLLGHHALGAPTTHELEDLAPTGRQSEIAVEIGEKLGRSHYSKVALDDELSGKIFDIYIRDLDPTRSYFLGSDIDEFAQERAQFDDQLKEGNLDFAFRIFNRYRNRLAKRLHYVIKAVENDLDQLDFTKQERLESDREESPWPKSEAELDELWRKRLKGEVLNLMLENEPRDEIKKTLLRRYTNQLRRLEQTNGTDVFQLFMNAYAAAYDPHSSYFAPHQTENFNIYMSLSLEGIGAVLQGDGEYVKVLRLVTGGPADKAGELKADDRIVGVGQGKKGEILDITGMRLDEVVSLIRGPRETLVRLEIIPAKSQTKKRKIVEIVRNKVDLEEQSAKKQILKFKNGDRTRKIGVIEIPTFYADFRAMQAGDPDYKSTSRDVTRLIRELEKEGIEGLVIDLRNNGGGSLQEANALVGLFIDKGPTVQIRDSRGSVRIGRDRDPRLAYRGPLAVLVNRLSASASEIFAAAIQDYGRGLVVGSQTFGKGTVQTLIPVTEGQLKLTQAKFYRISGESTQHRGVIPDLELPTTLENSEIGESSLDQALPWDAIEATRHGRYGRITPYLERLEKLHRQRAVEDPDFVYLTAQVEKLKQQRREKHISLSEPQRLAEKEAEEKWLLGIENKRRIAKGQTALRHLDELEEEKKSKGKDEPEEDFILREAGAVLRDYIDLTARPMVSKSSVEVSSSRPGQ